MSHPSVALRYHREDLSLRDVEELSRHGRISCAFVRLCLEEGCPQNEGRLSLAMLLDWLFDHYPKVRAAAGLPAMPEVEGLSELVTARLMMGNAMLTLLEYSYSRASDPLSRRHLTVMMHCVERALDR